MHKSTWRNLKVICALIFLGLLVYLVDLRELWKALANLTLGSVLLLLFISVVLIAVSALKWKLFIEGVSDAKTGQGVSLVTLFKLYLMGYFVNLLLPSYVGGDVVRSYYVGKKIGQHEALSATVLERYTGLVAMVALAFVFMWYSDLVTSEIRLVVGMIGIGLVLVTFIALSPRVPKIIEQQIRWYTLSKHLTQIQAGFQLVRSRKKLLVQTLLLSFVYHGLAMLNTIVCGYAVGWSDVRIVDLAVVLPLILLVGSIPVAPSGLGIQEGAFLYFLKGIGASPAQALGIALVLRAKSYVLALFGWVVWVSARKPTNPSSIS